MTCKELKEYLSNYDDEKEVAFLVANPPERKIYEVLENGAITDLEFPVFYIQVGEEKNMDTEMIAACEEDERAGKELPGQMEISDFPEVMP